MQKFTHLHVHSHYSLLDGLPKIDELLNYVKELGMDSVAITDHGALYGAVEFYKKAKTAGVKPIIGAELYVALEGMRQERPGIDDKRYHLVLLAKNEEGYKNLVKLITKAHLEGFYYKPRIDEELLAQYASGLIASTACLQGKIPVLIMQRKLKEAEDLALKYQEIFGKDNFYLELQYHEHIPEQKKVNDVLIEISRKTGIPLIATNDVHYLKKEDAEAQDILMLINTGADQNDPERLSMIHDDFSLKSPREMFEHFREVPEAIENTQKIVEACNFQFELGKTKLPHFEVPNGKAPDDYLKKLTYERLEKKFPNPSPEIIKRIEYELSVIKQTGFAPYFLIVQDFVNWAKQNRIVVGPGRGSATGSLVSYVIGITNVDPIKYGLMFERFLNLERIAMPDIDLDFTDRRRDEVINYVAQKYGRDKVAQIITFGTMAARAVIRDVGRALKYTYSYCDQAAKMIPFGFTLDDTLKKVREFKNLYDTDEQAKRLIDFAKKLEGVARHASTHACGVVISAEPLENVVPLQHPTQNDQNIVTQYEMHAIEDLGLLKMDFLGLKNLTIIEDTLSRVYVVQNKKINIENLPRDDKETYKLLQEGKTAGIFQLESGGITRYLVELKPTEFEDIIAMISLFRPGPMELIPEYIARKHKRKRVEYLHPKMEQILKNTYGIMIYQEQLMQVAQQMAGFTLGEADVLRKAVGKKIKSLLEEQKEKLINGMTKNGIKKSIAEKIWEWVLPFASYGFNRCLSGDVKIQNSETGEIFTIKQLYQDRNLVKKTFSFNEKHKIFENKILDIINNGVKPVFEVITRNGRKLKATENHPFLTSNGWQILKNIRIGERIATPRSLPEPQIPIDIENCKLALLGYLLAEGNFCHPYGFYFYSSSKEEIKDYITNLEKFDNTIASIDNSKSAIAVYSKRKNKKISSEAVEWINNLGLRNKKATDKFFPQVVFQLSNKNLSILIGKMFQGDGCINLQKKGPEIFYATSSMQIASGLQHLLLRFGIISTIHFKKFKYRKTIKKGYTVSVSRFDNIYKFLKNFSLYFIGKKRTDSQTILRTHPIINKTLKEWSARGSKDTIPCNLVFPLISNAIAANVTISRRELATQNNFAERLLYEDERKIGFLRETVDFLSEKLQSQALKEISESDIYWDGITSVKPAGEEITYDLSMEKEHNFIANDIFVHNSHAAAYATIAYQTAYLKTHFPVEFMASLLTSEKADVERIAFLINETKKMGIEVLPPDINESLANFTVVPNQKKIRFGLTAIKNVGTGIVEAITQERKTNGPFKSIADFINRLASKDLNKKSFESLIKTGVFDRLAERNQLLSNMERLLEWSRDMQKTKSNGQKGLFDGGNSNFNHDINLLAAAPASNYDKLTWEKELLGLFVTSNPLEDYRKIFERKASPISTLKNHYSGQRVRIGGIISSVKKIITKKGRPMLFMSIEDLTDKTEVIVFPGIIERNPVVFQENKIVFVVGKVDHRDNMPKIICDEIEEITEQ